MSDKQTVPKPIILTQFEDVGAKYRIVLTSTLTNKGPVWQNVTAQISVVGTLTMSIFFGIIAFAVNHRRLTFFRTFY